MRRGKAENQRQKQRRRQRWKRALAIFLASLITAGQWANVWDMSEGRCVQAAEIPDAEIPDAEIPDVEILDAEELIPDSDESGPETIPDTEYSSADEGAGAEGGDVQGFIEEIQEVTLAQAQPGTEPVSGNQTGTETNSGIEAGTENNSGTENISGTEAGTEIGSETEPETETNSGREPETETGKADGDKGTEKVYLGIDNIHVYEGMEQSFSDGYSPVVENGCLELVIPYVASGNLKGDKLTVDLEFPQDQEAPCELKNYQKDVEKKRYCLAEGRMVETEISADDTEAYLYKCQISILDSASPGQYSVTVKARGYTETMELVKLDYQIFFRIPEPEPEQTQSKSGKKAKSSGNTGGSTGSYGGSGGEGGSTAEEEVIRQPKMLLESCSLAGKALEAGNQEEMQVSLQNCSQSQAMYNLKVVVQMESTSLSLEKNSFYFEKVGPEETIDIQEAVGVAPDAEAGTVPVTFTFEYEDKKGNAATGTETMNLIVTQPVKMELEKAEIPAQVYASDTIAVPVSVLNLSRTGVYNARVHLEGTGLFPTGDVFLGNMDAGSSAEGSMNIYIGTRTMEAIGTDSGTEDGEKYGSVQGTITLSYEDALGETHEISRDYQTEIKKAQILSLNVEEKSEGNPWWISVLAVVFLGMMVVILLLAHRLRKKSVLLEEAGKTGALPGRP